jgi:hypothetical protein
MTLTTKRVIIDSICSVCKLAVLCGFLLAICVPAGAVPATPKPSPQPQPQRTGGSILKNPHLKGVEQTESRVQQKVKKAADAVTHHPWHRRWDYHSWIVLHRGLGVIRGFVHAPDGAPMASAKVLLRHPNGSFFVHASMKHITYTDAQGNFMMVGVRAGHYRVFSQHGKQKGHAQTAVHPGLITNVAVKI